MENEFVGGYTPTLLRNLRWAYAGWAGVLAGAIVLQFYLAGRAVFGMVSGGLVDFSAHAGNGWLIAIGMLIGIGLAFLAQVPWRVTGINVALFGLVLLQPMLAWSAPSTLAAIHVVNAGLIFAGTAYLLRRSVVVARATRAAETLPDRNRDAGKTPVAAGTVSGGASDARP